jgi:hypothetical protein
VSRDASAETRTGWVYVPTPVKLVQPPGDLTQPAAYTAPARGRASPHRRRAGPRLIETGLPDGFAGGDPVGFMLAGRRADVLRLGRLWDPMTSRRSFLHLIGSGLVIPFAWPAGARGQGGAAPGAKAVAMFRGFGGALGLQLYSLRNQMEKDVPGSLAMVRDWGLSDVETASFYGRTAAAFAQELKRANLKATGMHAGYELLRDNLKQAVADAKALGVTYVTVAWIPHDGPFTREHAERAASHFTEWGRALKNEGLRFMYHLHGYEFAPAGKGTLFETIQDDARRHGATRWTCSG